MFIAVVGITAGSSFVSGLTTLGLSLFLWGIASTTLPMLIAMFMAKYCFRFHPGILLGCCAGARCSTASIGMLTDAAKSQVPVLGYTVTYAVSAMLLAIFGMVMVAMMSWPKRFRKTFRPSEKNSK